MSVTPPRLLALALLLIPLGCGNEQPPQHAATYTPPADDNATPTQTVGKGDWYAQHHWQQRTSCGQDCRYASHQHSEVKLVLGPNGSASGMDHGELLEETTSIAGNTGRITRWERQWRGDWTEADSKITVSLKPHALECERVQQNGATDNPCKDTPLRLVCEEAEIQVSQPTWERARGWVCIPDNHRHIDQLTPLPWVFGKDHWLLALERGDRDAHRNPRRRYAIGNVAEYPIKRKKQ